MQPSRFFHQQWTLTLPSHPTVRIFRATPSHLDVWVPLVVNPSNNEFQDSKDKVWDDSAISAWKVRAEERYIAANADFHPLEILIELDNAVVGYGTIFQTHNGVGNVGIVLDQFARGRGLGKSIVQALIQLGFSLGMEMMELGTMKVNEPMRGVMQTLGIAEKEEQREVAGRGVVAEIIFEIPREEWRDVGLSIEFGGQVGGE